MRFSSTFWWVMTGVLVVGCPGADGAPKDTDIAAESDVTDDEDSDDVETDVSVDDGETDEATVDDTDGAGETDDSDPSLGETDTDLPTSNQAPSVVLLAPVAGADLTGTVLVRFAPTDSDGLVVNAAVEVDGTTVAVVSGSPWNYSWDTTGEVNGAHVVRVVVTDDDGATGSDSVTVDVDNPVLPPDSIRITQPGAGATICGLADVQVSADAAIVSVELIVGGVVRNTDGIPPFSLPLDTTALANGATTLTVRGSNGLGDTVSVDRIVTIDNVTACNEAPAIVWTSPTGTPASKGNASITMAVTATDDVGVVRVRFIVDGAQVLDDTSAPYVASWDASAATEGEHTLRVVAEDTVGLTSVSELRWTIDRTAPTVDLTLVPVAPASYLGTTFGTGNACTMRDGEKVRAVAADALGLDSSTWRRTGAGSGTAFSGTVELSTSTAVSGSMDLTFQAVDRAGNSTEKRFRGVVYEAAVATTHLESEGVAVAISDAGSYVQPRVCFFGTYPSRPGQPAVDEGCVSPTSGRAALASCSLYDVPAEVSFSMVDTTNPWCGRIDSIYPYQGVGPVQQVPSVELAEQPSFTLARSGSWIRFIGLDTGSIVSPEVCTRVGSATHCVAQPEFDVFDVCSVAPPFDVSVTVQDPRVRSCGWVTPDLSHVQTISVSAAELAPVAATRLFVYARSLDLRDADDWWGWSYGALPSSGMVFATASALEGETFGFAFTADNIDVTSADVFVDGVSVGSATHRSIARDDCGQALGACGAGSCERWGFEWVAPAGLSAGTHSVTVVGNTAGGTVHTAPFEFYVAAGSGAGTCDDPLVIDAGSLPAWPSFELFGRVTQACSETVYTGRVEDISGGNPVEQSVPVAVWSLSGARVLTVGNEPSNVVPVAAAEPCADSFSQPVGLWPPCPTPDTADTAIDVDCEYSQVSPVVHSLGTTTITLMAGHEWFGPGDLFGIRMATGGDTGALPSTLIFDATVDPFQTCEAAP